MEYLELKNKLNLAAKAYYLLGEELMPDEDYDIVYKQLLMLEEFNGSADLDSPSQRVGYTGLNNEQPHKHGKMLSLDNVTSKEELSKFFKANVANLVAMPKLDGLAMALYYDNGILTQALLRGDGVYGADVTDLAIQMSGVPLTVSMTESFRVAGEIITFSDHWEKDGYKNHRNYVSGSMNKVDTNNFKSRALSFVAFDSSLNGTTFSDKLTVLNTVGAFNIVEYLVTPNGTAEKLRAKFRDFFKYCDGVVYAQNDLTILLGATSHHPYNKVAYKFPEEQKHTKLLGVVWEMGRTRTLTPVAIMEPVILDGATVTRASLSNLQNIQSRGIAINDVVIVHKAKEIIPQILGVFEKAAERIDISITKCPVCLHEVTTTTSGIVSCQNNNCAGSAGKALTHFCKAVGIKGIGNTIAESLVESLTLLEVLNIDDSDLCHNSTIAAANAPKVVKSIKVSLEQPRWKAWVGLGIPLCGNSLCQKLPVTSLLDLSTEKLLAMPKVADKTANNIMNWLGNNKELITSIEALYKKIQAPKEVNANAKKIYITGKLAQSRSKMKPILEEKGYTVTSSLSRNTDLFLAGDGALQHKINKARELGVEIIYEKDL